MTLSLNQRYRILTVLVVSLATVAFHYGLIVKPTHAENDLFHAIHGRLCYIPIILGAIWYSVWGGLATAAFIIVLTLPYSVVGEGAHHGSLAGELTEMVFYVAIGMTAGILIELQRGERKQREALARELEKQARLSSLGQMAAGLAHEIKNPLGSIQGSAEILSDDFPENSPKHDLLQVLSKETGRLNRVVEDFLNFARPRPLERSPTQINSLLQEMISQIEMDNRAQNVRITRDLDQSIAAAPLDAEQLHQVFLNIALNAINAMPNGGSLRVESHRETMEGRSHIVVRFRDSGIGMAQEDIDKIFDPFYTRSDQGTGLGLSISHTIVQNHGGHIRAEENDDRGTTITIMLPVIEDR
ncbi:MAG: nitrogen regulation protein NR(II) [Candidatus Krumholzibacteriia bacterium]